MVDPIGTITSWALIIGASALIVYHFAMVFKYRRLETRSAAAIMFGTGWLIIVVPQRVYQALPADAQNTLNWLGILVVLVSIALDLQRRWIKRKPEVPNQHLS